MVALGWPGNDYNVISFKEFERSRAKRNDPQKALGGLLSELSRATAGRNGSSDTDTPNFLGSCSIARGGDSS